MRELYPDSAVPALQARTLPPLASITKSVSSTPASLSGHSHPDFYSGQPASPVPSFSRLCDIQLAAEVDYLIRTSAIGSTSSIIHLLAQQLGDTTLTGAYYYQDQTSPSILNGPPSTVTFSNLPTTASQIYATRGPIDLGQLRLSFGTGKSVRVPIAITYSNRSELITHPVKGLQFGVNYSFSGK